MVLRFDGGDGEDGGDGGDSEATKDGLMEDAMPWS